MSDLVTANAMAALLKTVREQNARAGKLVGKPARDADEVTEQLAAAIEAQGEAIDALITAVEKLTPPRVI